MVDPQIKQRAIEWLISLDSGEDVLQHWPGFQSWLNECPEHRQVYLWVERTWREAGMLITEIGSAGFNGVPGPRDRPSTRRRRTVRPAPVVIVSVILVLAVMHYLWSRVWT